MKKILFLFAFVASASIAQAQKEYKLHYTFKKGDAYEWVQTANVKQHVACPGFDQNNESTITATALMKVIETTANGAKFEMEFVKMALKNAQANLSMDSEGDTTKNLANKAMRAMKGKKVLFTLSKHGEVESVENAENLWSGLTTANGFKESEITQMKMMLENSYGKSAIKQSLEATIIRYPEAKTKVGLTWSNHHEVSTPIPLKTDDVWTFQSAEDPKAVMISDGQIATTDSTKVITVQGFKATTNFKGRRVINSKVDLSTGWAENSKAYAEQKGYMILLAGGQIPEDMKMQMEVTTESEYTIKKQ